MRTIHASLLFIGLAAISCGDVGFGPTPRQLAMAPATLPSVSAPAPAPEAIVEIVREIPVAELAERIPTIEERILSELRQRHTGLAGHELAGLADTIVAEARRHELDPALVMAVIEVESAFFHRAVSHVGAMGLMQLLPSTAEELAHKRGLVWRGPESLFDPVLNVKLGVAYLKYLEDRFGSTKTALAAYNWGPGAISRRLRAGRTLPAEYITRVMTSYDWTRVATHGEA